MTGSMRRFLDETGKRREKQMQYNEEHGITPQTIIRKEQESLFSGGSSVPGKRKNKKESVLELREEDISEELLRDLKNEMIKAAEALEFERAAELRDKIKELKEKLY